MIYKVYNSVDIDVWGWTNVARDLGEILGVLFEVLNSILHTVRLWIMCAKSNYWGQNKGSEDIRGQTASDLRHFGQNHVQTWVQSNFHFT